MNEDKSSRYHRLRRRAAAANAALGACLLLVLMATGGSALLRDAAVAAAGGSFSLAVASFVLALGIVGDAARLPLSFYQGVTLERRYGLSTLSTGRWWRDHLRAGAVALVLNMGAALIVCWLIRWDPVRWWMLAAAVFGCALIGLAHLAPVVLFPLFYECKPLDRDALVARLVRLAERSGARVMGVFEWRLSDTTRRANAALAGLGRTRRIFISDTLLAEHSDDEIEVILAHELAHHVHRDIWTGIAVETLLVTLGLYVADVALARWAGVVGLTGKGDVAALPVVALAVGGVSLALLPVANGLSRAHERRADRYALDMTGNAAAFVSAMRRLGAQNLAEERPSRLVQWLFHTHPPVSARIDAARVWTTGSTNAL